MNEWISTGGHLLWNLLLLNRFCNQDPVFYYIFLGHWTVPHVWKVVDKNPQSCPGIEPLGKKNFNFRVNLHIEVSYTKGGGKKNDFFSSLLLLRVRRPTPPPLVVPWKIYILRPFFFGNWIYVCQNKFYTWFHSKIFMFCPVIMVYFFH